MKSSQTISSRTIAPLFISSLIGFSAAHGSETCKSIFARSSQPMPPTQVQVVTTAGPAPAHPIPLKVEHQVLAQALSLHVSIHEITPDLTRRAIKHFADLMDPNKILFTNDEYQALAQPSPEILAAFHASMQSATDRTPFEQVNQLALRRFQTLLNEVMTSKAMRHEIMTRASNPDIALAKNHPRTTAEAREHLINHLALMVQRINDPRSSLAVIGRQTPYQPLEALLLTLRQFRTEAIIQLITMNPESLPVLIAKAYVSALDPHSDVLLPHEAASLGTQMAGQFAGIGVALVPDVQGFRLMEIQPNSGAEAAGLQKGDIITHISVPGSMGLSTPKNPQPKGWTFARNLPVANIRKLLVGEPGTQLSVRVLRDGQSLERQLTRKVIQSSANKIHSMIVQTPAGPIAHIKLDSFYQDSASQLRSAILETTKAVDLKGLVLDLRNNGGGLVKEATHILGLFIKDGPALLTSNGSTTSSESIDSQGIAPVWLGPLIVITNSGSASASEILSGTLQAYGRAVIAGEKQSFGKGSMQHLYGLSEQVGMKVTVALFFNPAGRSPQLDGVESDIVISRPEDSSYLERDLENAIQPFTLPSIFTSEFPLMPNRPQIVAELKRLSEQRQAAVAPHTPSPSQQQATTTSYVNDPAAEEAHRILQDLIKLTGN